MLVSVAGSYVKLPADFRKAKRMDRSERHAQILDLLNRQAGASASELARLFKVSRMTIHRDLRDLHRRGHLQRIRGGAAFSGKIEVGSDGVCRACGRDMSPQLGAEMIAPGGDGGSFCCAACGLRQVLGQPKSLLLVRDQLSGRQLPAAEAYFLVNSLAAPCCQPSILCFAREEEASMFQDGFGGTPARLEEALEFLRVAAQLDR